MTRLWIACIGAAAATVAISFLLHRQPLPEHGMPPSSAGVLTAEAHPTHFIANAGRRPERFIPPTAQPLPDWDTTGLLQEGITVGELLDEIEADVGEGFAPVDREHLAALLRSDPELRRAVRE